MSREWEEEDRDEHLEASDFLQDGETMCAKCRTIELADLMDYDPVTGDYTCRGGCARSQ